MRKFYIKLIYAIKTKAWSLTSELLLRHRLRIFSLCEDEMCSPFKEPNPGKKRTFICCIHGERLLVFWLRVMMSPFSQMGRENRLKRADFAIATCALTLQLTWTHLRTYICFCCLSLSYIFLASHCNILPFGNSQIKPI